MEKYIQQDSEFVCSSGAGSDKIKVYALVPLSVDCPIWKRLYDEYDLNGVHGSHDEIDPMSINFNLAEKGINNGVKGYALDGSGVDIEWSLTVISGGDNSFQNRIETLQDDAGGVGGDIIQEIIIKIVSPITLEDGSSVSKTRYYQIRTDSMDVFGTSQKSDGDTFEWAQKIINRPKVYYDFDPSTLKSADELEITVTDTLAFDAVTGVVSGTIEIDELDGNTAKMSVHLVDPKDRGNTIMFGASQTISSTNGIFNVNISAPILEDSETVQVNAVIAGRNVLFTDFVVNEAPGGFLAVSGIEPQTAKIKFDIQDNSNIIGDKQVTYVVEDAVTNQVVSSGSMKATSLRTVQLEELKPNRNYTVSLKFNSTELVSQNFKTAKDTVAPVISVANKKIEVPVGEVVDYDYHVSQNKLKVVDDIDGELTSKNIEVDVIDTTSAGEYQQGISAKDTSGNKSFEQITIVVK